ncbi:hypothetical protein N7454_007275, partial [Penicillium verhagenii]
ATVAALQSPHHKAASFHHPEKSLQKRENTRKDPAKLQYLNHLTEKFIVNSTHFPQVPFDIGESYAGLLSNTPHGNSSLFFWFFPSTNPSADREVGRDIRLFSGDAHFSIQITIWLNGGPGCSSLDGLLQENGPFLWQSGTFEPVRNPYSWSNLTNIVQPGLDCHRDLLPCKMKSMCRTNSTILEKIHRNI